MSVPKYSRGDFEGIRSDVSPNNFILGVDRDEDGRELDGVPSSLLRWKNVAQSDSFDERRNCSNISFDDESLPDIINYYSRIETLLFSSLWNKNVLRNDVAHNTTRASLWEIVGNGRTNSKIPLRECFVPVNKIINIFKTYT